MVRLRNAGTGVVVNVDDVTAARLGDGWGPVEPVEADEPEPTKRKPARRRASSKSDD